jgi:antitoxin MazE
METNIIAIGNSKGIIIPSKLLKAVGFQSNVNIEVQEGKLVITPSGKARVGWADLIKKEVEVNGQANRLIPDFFEDEHDNDWQW